MPRAVTLQQVADAAGVHQATASRALNPATRSIVKPETAEKVLKAARDLGYLVNPLARGLRTSRTMTVGVLIPDITNPFYPPIVRGIDDELSHVDYVPLLASTDNNPRREEELYERLRARQVDGFVLATARERHPLIRRAAELGVKMVLVSRTVPGVPMSAVVLDEEVVMKLAITHLTDLGHAVIGHLAGPKDVTTGSLRRIGFEEACLAAGVRGAFVEGGTAFTYEEGVRTTHALLDAHPVTAIVASNDLMALGCLEALDARGLSCPSDVSVVGINDQSFLERVNPPLTSVSTPKYEMGRSAAQLLIRQMASTDPTPIEVRKLQPSLVVRGSTAPPPARH